MGFRKRQSAIRSFRASATIPSYLSAGHEPLPTHQLSTAIHAFIFPFRTNLYPIKGSAQNVSYTAMGTPPNRELVVQWSNVRHYDRRGDGAATVTF
jgi:hypothetical protein